MKLAIIHLGKTADLDENESNLLRLNIEAAENGADLIVNPELSIVSLFSRASPLQTSNRAQDVIASREFARWFAEERCPEFLDRLRAQVVDPYQKHIVAGVLTCISGYNIIYNSACVLGPNDTQHLYHKRFLTSDMGYVMKGASDLVPAQLSIGKVGVIVCADYSVPLIPRSLALNGSDLIVVPAALSSSTAEKLQVRAWENGIPFALANCYERNPSRPYNSDWMPESAIVGADGKVIDRYDECEDKILWADLDLSDSERSSSRSERIRGRRPSLYPGVFADLTSSQLSRAAGTDESKSHNIVVVTVSGDAVHHYAQSEQLNHTLDRASKDHIPVIVVLPEFSLEREQIQPHLDFWKAKGVYLVCGFVESDSQRIGLFDPQGQMLLGYNKVHLPLHESGKFQPGDTLESYLDLPEPKDQICRLGILSADDLLYPEAVEVHKNAGVDLLLISSRLPFDGTILFQDVAESRHMNVAAADSRYNGGIYRRFPRPEESTETEQLVAKGQFINELEFDLQIGRPGRGSVRLAGLEVVVRLD